MKNRTLLVECDAATAADLATAIRAYTDAAYPEGGSECAQVARQALLETVGSCEIHDSGVLVLRRRQLAALRACIRWYFSEQGSGDVKLRPRLETLLAADNKSARKRVPVPRDMTS